MSFDRKNLRFAFAVLLALASLLALPLAFLRLSGKPVMLYQLVQVTTLPVMTLLSTGISLIFPEKIKAFFLAPDKKFLLTSAALYLSVLFVQWGMGMINFDLLSAGAVWVTLPLAVIALSDEFKKLLPYWMAGETILLLVSGFTSENFTGLAGNWNWTFGMITALLPGIFFTFDLRYRKTFFLTALLVFFAVIAVVRLEIFPRSALFAAVGAIMVLALRQRIPGKKFRKLLFFGITVAILLFFAVLFCLNLPDTRFQIWRGAGDMIMSHPLAGVGSGQFDEVIRRHLTDDFYFTGFPAPRIDHAHNDLLNIFAECGIFGAIFYLAAAGTILLKRQKTPTGILAQWMFMVMLFCGIFDQHNLSVAGCFILCCGAGICLAPANTPPDITGKWKISGAVAGGCLILPALWTATINFHTTSAIRRGDLKWFSGDISGAKAEYNIAVRQKPHIHALYQLAKLNLAEQRPADYYFEKMKTVLKKENYLHTRRLKAVNAYFKRDFELAYAEISKAMDLAPFSVISAEFRYHLLQDARSTPEAINEAYQYFMLLCRMRGIKSYAELHSPEFEAVDDGPLPGDLQEYFFRDPEAVRAIFSGLSRKR